MRCHHLLPILALILGSAIAAAPARTAATAAPPPAAGPWAMKHDTSPAFTPNGDTVVFTRGSGASRRLYVAHRHGNAWSTPAPAPFSDRWMDIEPAMAPDGSFLVFASNRPAHDGGAALDGQWGGQAWPGRGGNLWRVDRAGDGWGAPARLPAAVNATGSTFSPAVAGDGSVYFMRADPASGAFRLYRSRFVQGSYATALPLALGGGEAHSDYDPAVAPDASFLVFSSDRAPASPDGDHLYIAFATPAGWSTPRDLGVAGNEARLGPDHQTLYFNASDQHVHRLPLAAWLSGRPAR
ncbi:MAG: TolB family protein [Rhodanobacter sp.]